MTFSLFEEMNRPHHHVECKKDADEELYQLFLSVQNSYITKVVKSLMRPEIFIDLFLESHHYIDCDRAVCRNEHRKNLSIIKFLFSNLTFQTNLATKRFTQNDFYGMVEKMLKGELVDVRKKNVIFSSTLTDNQLKILEDIVREYKLFDVPEDTDLYELVCSIMKCKVAHPIKVNNISHLALIFDGLSTYRMIDTHWQYVIEKRRLFVRSGTDKYVTSSTLSSAVHRLSDTTKCTATHYKIRDAVEKILREE